MLVFSLLIVPNSRKPAWWMLLLPIVWLLLSVSGYLALNLARGGDIRAARHQLAEGERLLVAAADRLSHALLLCDRAEVEALDRCGSAASEAFEAARKLAAELACGLESELGQRLGELERALKEWSGTKA